MRMMMMAKDVETGEVVNNLNKWYYTRCFFNEFSNESSTFPFSSLFPRMERMKGKKKKKFPVLGERAKLIKPPTGEERWE